MIKSHIKLLYLFLSPNNAISFIIIKSINQIKY